MRLTKFRRLRRAVEALSPHTVTRRIAALEEQLQSRGIPLEAQNTAITQEGIFHIDGSTGIATKVLLYNSEFEKDLTKAQQALLAPQGYGDSSSIEKFSPFHIMRCNALTSAAKQGWADGYRLSKRTSGRFFFRLLSKEAGKDGQKQVYQELEDQELYICKNCHWKVTSILVEARDAQREKFPLKKFFDVNFMRSWNSHGLLSKDYGFTKDMYPEDWLEICRVRRKQCGFCCENCSTDLSLEPLQRFLHVSPVDVVAGHEGYVRLECICIACLAEQEQFAHLRRSKELSEYAALLKDPKVRPPRAEQPQGV